MKKDYVTLEIEINNFEDVEITTASLPTVGELPSNPEDIL